MKSVLKGFLLCLTFTFIFSAVAHAEKNEFEKGKDDEGTVVYHVQYDYDAITTFLGISRAEYDQYWKEGLSISDMAEKQGILRRDTEGYFYTFHYDEMQKWRTKGALSEKDYFQLVYLLADEIKWFIDRNPNS
ncbi:hypothetical protein [Solibacillus sp. FSL K6-1523]|uniref:hypothetical protein n=1 Tax=Solibacillus sp. FSL K6-1523 TaxID=2921471 RepID=UPI0030FCB761